MDVANFVSNNMPFFFFNYYQRGKFSIQYSVVSAKTQSGWQSRVHFGQKINLTISLFFMDGLQVHYLFITTVKYLGAFASGFRDMP